MGILDIFANSVTEEAAPATEEAMLKNFGCKLLQTERLKYVDDHLESLGEICHLGVL